MTNLEENKEKFYEELDVVIAAVPQSENPLSAISTLALAPATKPRAESLGATLLANSTATGSYCSGPVPHMAWPSPTQWSAC